MEGNIIKKFLNGIPNDFLQVFVFNMLAKVFMLVITVFLIRILDPTQYAEFVIFTSLSGLVLGVLGSGIALSYVRYITELLSRNKKSPLGLHLISSVLMLILSILLLFLSPAVKNIYKTSLLVTIFAIIYGLVLSLLRLNEYHYQAKEEYVKSGIIDNLKNLLLFVSLVGVVIFIKSISINDVIYVYLLCGLITLVFGIYRIYRGNRLKDILSDDTQAKSMLTESGWLILYFIILSMFNQMDVIMISNLMTKEAVALYGVAFKYYSLMLTILPAILAVLRVRTSKKEYVDDSTQRLAFTVAWIKKSCKLVIPLCVITILLSGSVMPILNGDNYDASINAFRILVIGIGLSYIFAPNVVVMVSAKKNKTLCLISLFLLICNSASNYIFIPIMGINGAAMTTIISQAILNVSATLVVIYDNKRGNMA